ncbi:hypothetical protein LZ32DRAFT_667822 [Colletotrichum eremochloae]|nr:hypothetical protein LZ32DRAFT_667822 [Colletotrichum eremochloae]
MSANFDQQAADLASTLSPLQIKLKSLEEEQVAKQIDAQHEVALKTVQAVSSIGTLTQLLDGEFNSTSPPSGLADAVKAMDLTWKAAETAAEKCLDVASQYSVVITQFNDTDLGDWLAKSKGLDGALASALASTNDALQTQQNALQAANTTRATSQTALEELRRKLDAKRHKYDDADKYTWIFPPARLVLEALKPIIEELTKDVATAESAVATAEQSAAAAAQAFAEQQDKVQKLSDLVQHDAALKQQGEALANECQSLMAEIEHTQTELAHVKTERYNAWQLAAMCSNRAENAHYSLTKADYGTAVLQLVEKAMSDSTLKPQLVAVVDHLAQHDDAKGSIKGITTEDHPEGLLAYVQLQS